MARKGIILALVLFIGLGLYVFLVEKKKPVSEGKEIVLKFDKDKAISLTIAQDAKVISLKKEKEGSWQIVSPLNTPADTEAVKSMVDDLSKLSASQALEVEATEWEDFGLKKPSLEVTVTMEGAGQEKLSFGHKNPAGTSTYARLKGKDKVFLISTYLADSFKKEVFDLRNKIILSFDKEKVSKIELFYEKSLAMAKDKDNKWFLAGQEKMELDSDKINDLLWELADLKAKGIMAEEIKDPSLYGLDKPEVKVILTIEGQQKIILLGQKAGEKAAGQAPEGGGGESIYASLAGDPRLFLVEASLSSHLKKDLSELKKTVPPDSQPASLTGTGEKKDEAKPASEGSAGKK